VYIEAKYSADARDARDKLQRFISKRDNNHHERNDSRRDYRDKYDGLEYKSIDNSNLDLTPVDSFGRSLSRSTVPSKSSPLIPSIFELPNPPMNSSLNPPMNASLNPPMNASLNPPMNAPLNPPMNAPLNRSAVISLSQNESPESEVVVINNCNDSTNRFKGISFRDMGGFCLHLETNNIPDFKNFYYDKPDMALLPRSDNGGIYIQLKVILTPISRSTNLKELQRDDVSNPWIKISLVHMNLPLTKVKDQIFNQTGIDAEIKEFQSINMHTKLRAGFSLYNLRLEVGARCYLCPTTSKLST
jgi:hypothetical protein